MVHHCEAAVETRGEGLSLFLFSVCDSLMIKWLWFEFDEFMFGSDEELSSSVETHVVLLHVFKKCGHV